MLKWATTIFLVAAALLLFISEPLALASFGVGVVCLAGVVVVEFLGRLSR